MQNHADYYAGSQWPLATYKKRLKEGSAAGLKGAVRRTFAASEWPLDFFKKRLAER
jgi:hypothetical protein